MNEWAENMAPSMALTEKKPHRSGGCVGLFFQLFDWNRRFAKKKLFSRKLLPPARAKYGSQRFCEEKMLKTKLHLLADDIGGGFPDPRNSVLIGHEPEPRREMKTPGVVARLMGLESLPAMRKDRSRKSQSPMERNSREKKFFKPVGMILREHSASEKGNSKVESRPNKIQKTDLCERRTVTRFGADALRTKSVWSRSRKRHHNHSKLVLPVQSPRLSNSRSSCRTSRLLGAATRILEPGIQTTSRARSSITYPTSFRPLTDKRVLPPDPDVPSPTPTPCENCGISPNILNSASPDGDRCLQLEAEKFKPTLSSVGHGKGLGVQTQRQVKTRLEEKLIFGQAGNQASSRSLLGNRMAAESRVACLKSGRISSSDTFSAPQTQTSVSHSRPRAVDRAMGTANADVERKGFGSRTPIRKRQIATVDGQTQTPGYVNSTRERHSTRGDKVVEKDLRVTSCSRRNVRPISSKLYGNRGSIMASGSNGCNVVSVQTKVSRGTKKVDVDNACKRPYPDSEPKMGIGDRKLCPPKQAPLNGDVLGALLEQKLGELMALEEVTADGIGPKKSTATILQEIISALTGERPLTPGVSIYQTGNEETTPIGSAGNGEYMSPGSVLEASFSNGSGFSSSIDDVSGRKRNLDGLEYNNEHPQMMGFDDGILESKVDYHVVTDVIRHISSMLHAADMPCCGLKRSQLGHEEKILINSELILRSLNSRDAFGTRECIIRPSLLDKLEVLAGIAWNGCSTVGYETTRRFVIDCLVEYLGVKYGRYSVLGYRAWTKWALLTKTEKLVRDVVDAVLGWTRLAGVIIDDMIEHEMSCWSDHDEEAYEAGVEIDSKIFCSLIDEVVTDYYWS